MIKITFPDGSIKEFEKGISIEEMKAIANAGLTMPPKSTFIEPKLRSGITIYEF